MLIINSKFSTKKTRNQHSLMSNIKNSFNFVQRTHLVNKIRTSNTLSFFNQLTSDELLDDVEQSLPNHRERLFPPTETLSMFLSQVLSKDGSCQNVVNNSAVFRAYHKLPKCSTATGGYCRARTRLPIQMIQKLTRKTGHLLQSKTCSDWRWQNRHVKLVDGTTLMMPDTADNQVNYPQQRNQKPGLGFPICRLVGISCLSSGALLDACVGRFSGKGTCEQSLLRKLLNSLNKNDLLIGDAFYGTYSLLHALEQKSVDFLFEQMGQRKRCSDFSTGIVLGKNDHIQVINKPKICPEWMSVESFSELPETIKVREFKVGNKVLISSLTNSKKHSKKSLYSLYQKRWHIELDIRDIKTTLGMEMLSCKTAHMNEKEIWVHLLAYNLIRLAMLKSAVYTNTQPREISFKHCLQICLYSVLRGFNFDDRLLFLISKNKVGNRPNRVEPRAVKRRPKPFALMVKPRAVLQGEIKEKWLK